MKAKHCCNELESTTEFVLAHIQAFLSFLCNNLDFHWIISNKIVVLFFFLFSISESDGFSPIPVLRFCSGLYLLFIVLTSNQLLGSAPFHNPREGKSVRSLLWEKLFWVGVEAADDISDGCCGWEIVFFLGKTAYIVSLVWERATMSRLEKREALSLVWHKAVCGFCQGSKGRASRLPFETRNTCSKWVLGR